MTNPIHHPSQTTPRRAIAVVLLTAAPFAITACGVETLALASAAGSAARSSSAVYASGKISAAVDAPFQDVNKAIDNATTALALTTERENSLNNDNTRYLKLRDDRQASITIRVERRTPALTRVTATVGPFGHEPTARLLLRMALDNFTNNPLPPPLVP